MISATNVTNAIQQKLFDLMLPAKTPDFLRQQADAVKELLPYENCFEDEGRSIFVLSDGAIGTYWEIEPISHELQSEKALGETLNGFCKIFEAVSGDRFTFQLAFESMPSDQFLVPDWEENPNSFARQIIKERIEAIKSLKSNPGNRPRLMERRVKLFLRVEFKENFFDQKSQKQDAFDKQIEILNEAVICLRDQAKLIEDIVQSCARIKFSRGRPEEFIDQMRQRFGDTECDQSYSTDRRLSAQIIRSNVEWSHDAVGVGGDTWEIVSWADQPNVQFEGMLVELLKVDIPLTAVVNIRPVNNTRGLEALANAVKNGGDAKKERQRDELYLTEKKLAYGEKLLSVSLHVLVRNVGRRVTDAANLRLAENLCKQLSASTNVPFIVEKFAALAVFMSCLPFGYSRRVAGFIGRESRVLSSALGSYLPLYCGTKGEERPCQLMQSRAGEALWINPRCSPTNPHLAILGSSGGGKSFYLSNLIVSEVAANPDSLIFHLDCITSCEYLAKSLGEDIGYQVIKPPEDFPNLFRGEITKERLPTIVGVLEVAVNLASKVELSAAEKVVLSDAILKTFNDNLAYSETVYSEGSNEELGSYVKGSGKRRVPRLGEIVNSFTAVCQQKGVDDKVGIDLREKLLPLFGSGPYAIVFDKEDYEEQSETPTGYYLYDLVGVQGDKVLSTITSLIVISDVMRVLGLPKNKGRKGFLIIDECGVNLSGESKFLENFVNEKWPTLRKKGIVCIGVTNKADHYSDLPAPSTIWSISANKLILPMTGDDIVTAEKKRLLENKMHLELIKSLQKRRGEYSECMWIGESMAGTFSYVPTGFDYWTAVNQDHDVTNLEFVFSLSGSYQKAISFLATRFPKGILDEYGDPRHLTEKEKSDLKKEFENA